MSNSEGDIVIKRADLPEVRTDGTWVSGPKTVMPASTVHARMLREQAYECIAIAERIDQVLAEQAEEKLDEEARALSCAVDRIQIAHHVNLLYWRKIARAAREVYGIK